VTREQRTVFGEIAEQYERARPGYPDELFETVLAFGDLHPRDRALEIGAGTGKATRGFTARGLDVTALEPSRGMAAVLREQHLAVEETTFEDWPLEPGAYRLLYAAQSWHWVDHDFALPRAAAALESGGTIALFWNLPQPFDDALTAEIDSVYAEIAPDVARLTEQWPLDVTLGELSETGEFERATKRTVPWTQRYSTGEYVVLMGTHSSHRMLDDGTRHRLCDAVAAVLDRQGSHVDVEYHADVYLARRR
jgi:SAM-dependent methyltransferase